MISWGVWAIMSRLIGTALSGSHSQALSTLGAAPIMVAMLLRQRKAGPGNRRHGVLCALLAGTVSCMGNVIYYHALGRGGKAALMVPLTALYPLTTVLLAMLLLREQLNRTQLLGALVSLVAIHLLNVPGDEGFSLPGLLPVLGPIVLWGTSGFLQKLSTRHISSELAALSFLSASIPFGVLFLLQSPLPANLSATTWWLVLGQGFFLALGSFAVLTAFANDGKASIVSPLAALYPVVSVPLAIGFLGERVGGRELAGIGLALFAVVALARETPPSSDAASKKPRIQTAA